MNERERILDLVKQGVITSEEALVLLENLANQKPQSDQTQAKKAPAASVKPAAKAGDAKTDSAKASQPDPSEAALAALNSQIAAVSGSLDATEAQLQAIGKKIAANEEQIIVLDTMEDLDTLTEAKYKERGALKQENLTLTQQKEDLLKQQDQLKEKVADLSRQKRDLLKHNFTSKVLPDDWQDQAKDAWSDVSKAVADTTSQIGSMVKSTMNTVLDNVDWKDVTVKVPGIATEKFSHTFSYPHNQATVLDVKVANGDVTLQTWDQDDIEVQATIKLFGKMSPESDLDAFLSRSKIDVDNDHFVFQVPNKRVQADLTISLPKRDFDHVAVRLLNGKAVLKDLRGKDFYVKSTNGSMTFSDLDAVMLETEGVNGSVTVDGGDIHDLVLETVNGDVKIKTSPQTLSLQTVNGTVRATLVSDFKDLKASTVNGNVKVAVPASVAVSGEARTRFGSVKSRMQGVEASGKSKVVALNRPGTGSGTMHLTTASGSIQLKDTDLTD